MNTSLNSLGIFPKAGETKKGTIEQVFSWMRMDGDTQVKLGWRNIGSRKFQTGRGMKVEELGKCGQ